MQGREAFRLIVVTLLAVLLGVPATVQAAPPYAAVAMDPEGPLFSDIDGGDFDAPSDAWALRSRFVAVNMALLPTRSATRNLAPAALEQIELNLFEDLLVQAQLERAELGFAGRVSWVGRIAEAGGYSEITLSIAEDHLSGTVRLPNGQVIRVRYLGNGMHVIQEMDMAAFPDESGVRTPPASSIADDPLAMIQADDGSEIDVLAVYTTEVGQAYGGDAGVTTALNGVIATSNTGNQQSGAQFDWRLVGVEGLNYTSGGFGYDLDVVTDDNDGIIDEVHALRDQYKADLVVLINDVQSACGIGWVPSSLAVANAPFGFSVVNMECAISNFSMQHEMGHNIGLAHDRQNAGSTSPAVSYGYGYQDPQGEWRTILAYVNSCPGSPCTRINYFSNPNVTQSGRPMGVAIGAPAEAAAAQALNVGVPIVANYRSITAPPLDTPNGLVAAAQPGLIVGLAWNNVSGADSYIVERSPNGSTWSFVAEVSSASFLDTGLTCKSRYYYRVQAANDGGDRSEFTSSVNAQTGDCNPLSDGGFETGNGWSFNTSGNGDTILTDPRAFERDKAFILQADGVTEFATTSFTSPITAPAGTSIDVVFALAGVNVANNGTIGLQIAFTNDGSVAYTYNCIYNGARGTFDWQALQCANITPTAAFNGIRISLGWTGVSAGVIGWDNVYVQAD
ncbi:MAG: hypothetical protein GYB68_06360 [Chloroflexi bacterium]|nr:hypothetical protein [Chloroflexota bacterium]